jgi:hypothetical protein
MALQKEAERAFPAKAHPAKGESKGKKFEQRIPEAGGPHLLLMVHQSVSILPFHDAVNGRRIPLQKGISSMLHLLWTTRSIDSLAMKHPANANSPHVRCLKVVMQFSFTAAQFLNLLMTKQ